ncbi:MAG: cell surface protein SprA, partial [Chitinophagales bacterium]
QSLLLQVGDLPDGEGKGAFKRIDMDMRRFKKLKMFVHAESIAEAYNDLAGCQDIEDGDVAAFIRLGDDFQNNYYEYEVPLKITTPITDDIVQDVDVRRWLWPEENEIELNLQDLVDLKLNRNFEFNSEGVNVPRKDKAFSNFTYIPLPWDTTRFAKITVVGSPDLGKVKQVMLGIKNPKRNALTKDYDDGMSKCGEVWFNELRLTDFNEEAGYAALARIDVKLADWGNIALSGNAHTVGFGTLEQRVHQRFLDNYMEYDLSTNLEFGKFFPDRWNLRLPVYAGVSQSVSTPEYDPYDTDIKLEQLMDSLTFFYGEQIADTANLYKKQVQERTTTKSINITNARKERSAKAGEKGKGGKPRTPKPWDIENWGATYAFTQTEYSDHIIQSDKVRRHKGSLDYSYNAKPKYITPFSKLVKSKSLYLRPIKDFNFNLVPNNLSFRTDIDRKAGILNLRQLGGEEVPIKTTYDKFLTWDRYYGLKYNPAKSINLDFTANKRNIIDENQFTATTFQGLQDTLNAYTTTPGQLLPPGTDPYGFSLYGSPYGYGGRPRGYDQSTNISYNVPIDKFPLLSWTKLRTRYGATYGWTARPKALADTLGNTIDNSQSFQVNAELDFNRLYNSIPALKKYNSTRRTSKSSRSKDKAKPKEGEEEDGKKKKRTTTGGVNPVAKTLIRPLLLVRRLSLTYNERNSTEIPGYMMSPQILGIHNGVQQPAPGWGFTLGKQPNLREFLTNDISQKGWISSSEYLTDQVKQSSSNTFNLKANLEPFKDFKIDVNMNLDYSRNHSEFFKVVGQGDDSYNNLSKIDISNFSISYMSLNTIFDEFDTLGISETFRVFEQNADEASQLLAGLNPFSSGPFVDTLNGGTVLNDYGAGYGPYSQDVLVPAFLAAYAGRNLDDVGANPFALLPLPNWRVTYNGLTKLKPFKKIFANMNISHGYNSTLTINNFRNTLEFEDQYYDANILYDNKGRPIDQWMYYFVPEYIRESSTIDTLSGNFFTFYQIPNVTITEQFAPLIGLDITTQSGITASFDYKIARQLSMSFQNYRLTETRSEEFTIGGGYITEGLSIPFLRWGGEPINLENEIAFNFDFSYRDNISTIIFLNQDISEPATGMKTYRFQPSIDYTVNDQMRISLYYERTRNIPATSASFPITNTEGGIRLNFSL